MTLTILPPTRGLDLTGQIFGSLTCLRRNGTSTKRGALWLCRCVCGGTVDVPARDLLHKDRRSCGCTRSDSPWPERDAELTALWTEGLSTSVIAARMGITKNAVVGRATRIGLPGRPSPICRSAEPRVATIRRVKGTTLAPLASAPAAPAPPPRPESSRPRPGCTFPMWGDRERPGPNPRFCDAPSQRDSVYCVEHHRRCFTASASRQAFA